MVREYRGLVKTQDDEEIRDIVMTWIEEEPQVGAQQRDRASVVAKMAKLGEVWHG